MRILPFVLMLMPSLAISDEILLSGKVTDVTVYPMGATVTRKIAFQVPAGAHELIIADLPLSSLDGLPRISVKGAIMGAVQMRRNYVPPRDDTPNDALIAARDAVEAVENKIRAVNDRIAELHLEGDAASARIAFLRQIGEGDKLAQADLAQLRDLSVMIGEETLAARQAEHKAKLAARAVEDTLADLNDELAAARKQVAALVPEDKERAYVSVSVTSNGATDGILTITHFAEANWSPTYDFRLTTGDDPALVIDRGAMVQQYTGENWTGVNLSLSTVRPTLQAEPSEVYPHRLRILDNEVRQSKNFSTMALRRVAAPEMASMDEAMPIAVADYNGLSVTYSYGPQIDIASNADTVRISLGQLGTSATVFAKAVPNGDKTAFLMAAFSNDMNEIILPSTEASFYLDGQFVGRHVLEDVIAVGAETELAFGPIEGLRLSRTIADRNEGARGFVSRSNAKKEVVNIEIENLTDRMWDVRLVDRVPYSEQDDLEIEWTASVRPTVVDLDGKRGVLQWKFELAAKSNQMITLTHEIEWPDGKILR